jgi:hypothetical protein
LTHARQYPLGCQGVTVRLAAADFYDLKPSNTAELAPGTTSIIVQVTETVTTLNGKKKVKTMTTVQAIIPLSIT